MQVKVTVEIDGRQVGEHVAEMHGTLAEMEEAATKLGRQIACQSLQATVDAVPAPLPPFRQTASGVSRGTNRGRSSD